MIITSKTKAYYKSPSPKYSIASADTTPKGRTGRNPLLNRPSKRDTLPAKDSLTTPEPVRDTTLKIADSTRSLSRSTQSADSVVEPFVDTFNLKYSKDSLDAPVNYEAADSGVLLVKEKKFLLYGNTKTIFKDATLTASKIIINQKTNIVTAYSTIDSTGDVIARAKLVQSDQSFQSDTIEYNFKTQKGLTYNTFSKQDEMWIQAKKIKKVNENTTFARKLVMTTCDYDEPHFGFVANKGKFISGKLAVTGPIHPEFEGVPIPFYLPFGFFPLNKGRHSGLLPPQFAVTEQLGIGLTGLGYYHVVNDYWDVTTRGDIYSYGSWALNVIPTYRRRYKYSGSFNIAIQNTKQAFKGDPDYSSTRTFNISWSHSMDAKAKPGISFSANVNAGSTKFNQQSFNNPGRNVQNNLTSSVTFSKTWGGKNLTLSANHNQNNLSRIINLTLPDAGFSIPTFYPLQRKKIVGAERWYEKIGIGYNGVARNQVSFIDTAVNSFSEILDTLQYGAQHRFPLTMSLPPVGKLIISPSVSYEQTWLTRRILRGWNAAGKKIDTFEMSKGLFIDHQISFGVGLNTVFFGTFNLKGKKLSAIRHTVRPQFSINYKPDLSKGKYQTIQVDSTGRTSQFSIFDNNQIFRGYSPGEFGGISFGIDNNLEAKWKGKGDSIAKKIRLIDGFGFNSGYNFLAPSFKLSPFNLYLRSTIVEKINITASALLDPYQVDSNGTNIDKYAWSGGRINVGRIRNANISMSTRFQSKPRNPNVAPNPATGLNPNMNPNAVTDPRYVQDQALLQDYMRRNPAEFVDFNIPWSFDVNFALNMNRIWEPSKREFKTDLNANLQFNNSFSLTPKWNFTTNGYYDFDTKRLTQLNLMISREMHCWQMSIAVTPIGQARFFTITISPRSALLQDLRINRTRAFYDF